MPKKKSTRYFNGTDAAKFFGVTRAAVIKQMAAPKGALCAAVVTIDGKERLDMTHAAVKMYRVMERPTIQQVAPPAEIETIGDEGVVAESRIRKYLKYTLQEIFDKFGTLQAFLVLLQAVEKIESVHEKRIKSNKTTGALIDRKYVKGHVLGLVEQVFSRILTDLPAKLAQDIHAACESGASIEDLKVLIHDAISNEIKMLKKDARRAIRKQSNDDL